MTITPLINLDNIYLKREDLNTTGSAKDRAISNQIDNLIKNKYASAVISSTGNAAISALHFCQKNQVDLTVFLSPKIDSSKLNLIKAKTDKIIFSYKPISDAFKFAKVYKSYLLRQSTDPTAIHGYKTIGQETMSQLPQATSIFIPVGSGATLFGISQAIPSSVKIFAIQPASNCPVAKIYDPNFTSEVTSITDALTVKTLPLKTQIINSIKSSGGTGLIIQNNDILKSQEFLKKNNIITSNEGALALAGYNKAIKNKINPGKYPVILLTGTQR